MADGPDNADGSEIIVRAARKELDSVQQSIEENGAKTVQAVEKKLRQKRSVRARAAEATKHAAEMEAVKLEIFDRIDRAKAGSPYGSEPMPDLGATKQAEALLGNIRAHLGESSPTGESEEERTARLKAQVQKDIERTLRRQPVIEKHSKQVIVERPAEIPLPLLDLPVEEEIQAEVEAEIAARDAVRENDTSEDSD